MRTGAVWLTMLLAAPAFATGPGYVPETSTNRGYAPEPSTSRGYAPAGRAIVVDRTVGLCLLCHSGPFTEEHHQGNLAPTLAGVGARLSATQLRRQLVEPRRLNPDTIMPTYGPRPEASDERLAPAWRGKPLLDAQQIEDVVAFLQTLK